MIGAAPAQRTRPAPAGDLVDRRCFTVVSAGRTYGLPVEHIHTVFEMTAVTPVPLAPPPILGLINLRGKIVTAVSLRRRLRNEEPATTGPRIAVGIDYRNENFALVVDEVGDVLTLERASAIEIPPHLGVEGVPIDSVYRLEDLILPILDLGWILTFGKERA